jgi:hypothetical protein
MPLIDHSRFTIRFTAKRSKAGGGGAAGSKQPLKVKATRPVPQRHASGQVARRNFAAPRQLHAGTVSKILYSPGFTVSPVQAPVMLP